MKQWLDPEPVQVNEEVLSLVGGGRVVAEVLSRRGIRTVEEAQAFLNPAFYTPSSPYDLPNMDKAVVRVLLARANGEHVGIWGDFDVDGQTATTLLVTALRELGLNVAYYIPQRQSEGHGMSVEGVMRFIQAHNLKLVVTCDTGIAEHDAIGAAQAYGVDVIVTDHHKLPEHLPEAYACVNPQMLPSDHPAFTLPGVGCAFKFVQAIYDKTGHSSKADSFLDLVALGIVADVALLRGDARYLLQIGLKALRNTPCLGLLKLLRNAKISAESIDEGDIAYGIAPRLNALGRLSDANIAVELLSTDDPERAQILADRLEAYNQERKQITAQVYEAAAAQIEQDSTLLSFSALVVAHPGWPGGVLGIVANKLVEAWQRPVVLFSIGEDGVARGSARSVEGCDITVAIGSYSQNLMEFGGHTMAAGLSLDASRIPEFRQVLSTAVAKMMGGKAAAVPLQIDAYIPLDEVTFDLAGQLAQLAPFGAGHSAITLASRNVEIIRQKTLGRSGEHLRFTIRDAANSVRDITWWQWNGSVLPEGVFDIAYTLRESSYKDEPELQLLFVDFRVSEAVEDTAGKRPITKVEIVDYRLNDNDPAFLRDLSQQEPNIVIWNEAASIPDITTLRRDKLASQDSTILVIWSVPPDFDVLRQAFQANRWQRVILFSHDPQLDGFQAFVTRLAQLVKFRLNQRDGQLELEELAGLTAHSTTTVRKGIEWLASRGDISILRGETTSMTVGGGIKAAVNNEKAVEAQLRAMLQETAAFRERYATLPLETFRELLTS